MEMFTGSDKMTGLEAKNERAISGGTSDSSKWLDDVKTINNKRWIFIRSYMLKNRLIYDNILDETEQRHNTRVNLYEKLEKELKRPVIAFYHNFNSSAILEDADVDFLEEILEDFD